jgi:hypothetical protein
MELKRLAGMIPGSAAGATAAVPSSLPSADRLSAGTSAEIGATLSGAAQDGAAQDGAAQDGAEEDDAEEDDASDLDEAYAALVDVPMFEAEMGEMAAWRAMATIEGPPTKSLEASAPRAHPKPPTIPPSGNAAPRPSTARTLKPAASESETDYEPAQVMGRPSTAGARLA